MNRAKALLEVRRASSRRTICEVQREIYDACGKVPKPLQTKIRELVLESLVMAKKMDSKLREYKADWDVGIYKNNLNWRMDRRRRRA